MNVQVNGVILYYEKQGSGPPLVLLHGNGEDGRIFDRTAEVLAPHYTVYTIDSRCHGKSSRSCAGICTPHRVQEHAFGAPAGQRRRY